MMHLTAYSRKSVAYEVTGMIAVLGGDQPITTAPAFPDHTLPYVQIVQLQKPLKTARII